MERTIQISEGFLMIFGDNGNPSMNRKFFRHIVAQKRPGMQ